MVQPLRRFAPAPLVGEPLVKRWSLRNAKASPTRRGVTAGDGEVARRITFRKPQSKMETWHIVQPLRRFAPAPLVGEPLASRWWSCWTSKVFCNRERPGSAVSIHDCLPRLKAFFINFRKRLAKYRQKRYNPTRSSFYRCKALDTCLFSSVG